MTPEFFLYRDGTNIRIADMTRDQAVKALCELISDKRVRTAVGMRTMLPLVGDAGPDEILNGGS